MSTKLRQNLSELEHLQDITLNIVKIKLGLRSSHFEILHRY